MSRVKANYTGVLQCDVLDTEVMLRSYAMTVCFVFSILTSLHCCTQPVLSVYSTGSIYNSFIFIFITIVNILAHVAIPSL